MFKRFPSLFGNNSPNFAQKTSGSIGSSKTSTPIQFFNRSNGELFCEELVTDKGNAQISCADKVGAHVIGVRDISTAEKMGILRPALLVYGRNRTTRSSGGRETHFLSSPTAVRGPAERER